MKGRRGNAALLGLALVIAMVVVFVILRPTVDIQITFPPLFP
jgi:hypothetical protein